ncbi:MAG: tyrosine--tRNA ligase [Gemmataceae bacterium]|nr:tyrosine--tRNA ligase [Gemmataceae bacterium]MCI0738886.1 tyrosine--tRNA ligase [Gemmataceae bacterium]
MKSVQEQLALIRRGVHQIVPEEELVKKLERSIQTGKPLRVKYGIDPTGIDVHLGHTVPLRKLRLFQELGHQAVLIIGNYTALVGDPSGRDQTRAKLTQEQVEANALDYLKQISKIIDIDKTEVTRNGDWFKRFSFLDALDLMRKITVQRMLERDDFTKRREKGTPIYLHECLYPLMQGWDSVEIRADIELGGTEQLYSLLVGRELQVDQGQEPQICLTMPILRGLDGQQKMGKSLGNYIGVAMPPQEMMDKVMSIPDELLRDWFELLTDRPADQVAVLCDPTQGNPRDSKLELGRDITASYYGQQAGDAAKAEWTKKNSLRQDPSDIEDFKLSAADLSDGQVCVCKLLVLLGWAKSNNEARRAVEGGGVNFGPDRTKCADPKANIAVTDGLIIRFGRKIARLRID